MLGFQGVADKIEGAGIRTHGAVNEASGCGAERGGLRPFGFLDCCIAVIQV